LKIDDLLRVSVRQVIRHRRRYLGVVLAIALGVAGFINIITMSREVKRNFNEDLDLIGGATVIRVYFDNSRSYRPQWFRDNTLAALSRIKGFKEMTLTAVKGGQTNWHGQQYGFGLVAVDEAFWGVRNFWAQTGNLFGAEAVKQRKRECVLGAELARKIFGSYDVRGRTMEINNELYWISGVLGGVTDSSVANAAFLPLTTAMDRMSGRLLPDRLYLRCQTWDDVAPVAKAIPEIIKSSQSPEELHVEVSWEGLKRVQQLAWWIEFMVYLAISATFLLGGVGIWNVMMAAVVTRTREIGLKKAMGAEDKDILAQFLSEALCLSMGAALLGALVGRILMEILGYMIGSRPAENLFFVALALGFLFAVILGVGAGLYPSLRASRMEVVSAIRYE
jgi:putative ABC transport system permease protein